MPGIGPHPKGIHHWWARLPLPTARAVLFASVVDDPSEHPDKFPTEEAQNAERERLFDIIRRMMQKIPRQRKCTRKREPRCSSTATVGSPRFDPFAGGGSIPLEELIDLASRLTPVILIRLPCCSINAISNWAPRGVFRWGRLLIPSDRKRIGGTEVGAAHMGSRRTCVTTADYSRPSASQDWSPLS